MLLSNLFKYEESNKMTSFIKKSYDKTVDTVEILTSSVYSRVSQTIERVSKLDKAEVPHCIIAALLNENSKKNNSENPVTFEENEIPVLIKIKQVNRTRVGITKSQTTALIEYQKESNETNNEINAVPAT